MVWHHSLLLMNSFNKTEAAVFSCRLCFLRAFPFISLIFIGRHLEQLSLIVIDLTEVYLLLIYILSLLVVVATLSFHGKLYTSVNRN